MAEISGCVAGLLAGVATVAIGHPFDTVKMKGLYRGATSSFLGVAFESSLLFWIYSQTKHKLQLMRGESHSEAPPSSNNAFSLFGRVYHQLFVLCPSEPVKLKLMSLEHKDVVDVGIGILSGGLGGVATIIQTSADKDSMRNPFQILNTIYKRAGIRGCYTGLGPTILRAFPASAAASVTWELAVKLLGIKRD